MSAIRLSSRQAHLPKLPTIGVCATGDPRVDAESRQRCVNIVEMTAEVVAKGAKLPDGSAVKVVWSPILIDGEKQADQVARQFEAQGVNIIVCVPDTWACPQLTVMSLMAHFPKDTPLNLTCGNSGPKPGVVFVHALNGAFSQHGRLCHINVGTWPDTGSHPAMTEGTATALLDWCQAAITKVGLRGRRVVAFGHDSMGMETALQHVIPTRNLLGLEITRLDMKLLADMLRKGAYKKRELAELRAWIERVSGSIALTNEADSKRFDQSLAMYLIVRDLLAELGAVGGGFMSQLEWGSDRRGLPLPVADAMESLFNSTFDHNGPKPALPFATEADLQGLLTMLYFTWLSAGNPPLFMDFRKVWEPWEINAKADEVGLGKTDAKALWRTKGLVDGNNSGSASFNWAGLPGESAEAVMKRVTFPLADPGYFPGGGNSVTFITPGGIEGIAARMTYSSESNIFSLLWDEACTVELPAKLAKAVANTSDPSWPHTWVVPKYATMGEYKQFAPANHLHMTWGLKPAVLEYWLDLANVLSLTPWQARPGFVEGVDRPQPLLHLINGGETACKMRFAGR